ncbi:GYD domain-containing protein [Candidatus Latescibacterota bacterium]
MATYIMLINFTQQGIQNVKKSPDRIEKFKKALNDVGTELKAIYMVMGKYDFIAVIEAPNDEAAARSSLALGSLGNVHTETLRAFSADDFQRIVDSLP